MKQHSLEHAPEEGKDATGILRALGVTPRGLGIAAAGGAAAGTAVYLAVKHSRKSHTVSPEQVGWDETVVKAIFAYDEAVPQQHSRAEKLRLRVSQVIARTCLEYPDGVQRDGVVNALRAQRLNLIHWYDRVDALVRAGALEIVGPKTNEEEASLAPTAAFIGAVEAAPEEWQKILGT